MWPVGTSLRPSMSSRTFRQQAQISRCRHVCNSAARCEYVETQNWGTPNPIRKAFMWILIKSAALAVPCTGQLFRMDTTNTVSSKLEKKLFMGNKLLIFMFRHIQEQIVMGCVFLTCWNLIPGEPPQSELSLQRWHKESGKKRFARRHVWRDTIWNYSCAKLSVLGVGDRINFRGESGKSSLTSRPPPGISQNYRYPTQEDDMSCTIVVMYIINYAWNGTLINSFMQEKEIDKREGHMDYVDQEKNSNLLCFVLLCRVHSGWEIITTTHPSSTSAFHTNIGI